MIFEVFLAILITAFLILFIVSLITAYSNYKSIKRIYELMNIIREREEQDYRQIKKLTNVIVGDKDGNKRK